MGRGGDDQTGAIERQSQRLDRWLWFSRVIKSRTSAAQLVEGGKVRVNRVRVVKPSHSVRAGDVLTVALRGGVQVLKVLAPGARRGPPAEARLLYEVLSDRAKAGGSNRPDAAGGRPTKRDRRQIDRFTDREQGDR